MKTSFFYPILVLALTLACYALGGTGTKMIDFFNSDDQANSACVTKKGEIYLGGATYNGSSQQFAWAKLDKDGNVLNKVATPMASTQSIFNAVGIMENSKLVAAGWVDNGTTKSKAIARYLENGKLDPTFGDGGIVVSHWPPNSSIRSLAVLDFDRGIAVTGSSLDANESGRKAFVDRYTERGALDTSFGTDGHTSFEKNILEMGHSVQVADGKIWAIGRRYDIPPLMKGAVVRLESNGEMDSSFSSDGSATVSMNGETEIFRKIWVSKDGKDIYVGGYTKQATYNFGLAKLLPNGDLDKNFNTTGILVVRVGPNDSGIMDLVVDSKKRIVAVGPSFNGTNWDYGFIRVLPDGTLDTSFHTDGIVVHALGTPQDQPRSLILRPQNGVCAVGSSSNGSNEDMAVVCLKEDGNLDQNFGIARY